jgi:hypothetical protein
MPMHSQPSTVRSVPYWNRVHTKGISDTSAFNYRKLRRSQTMFGPTETETTFAVHVNISQG